MATEMLNVVTGGDAAGILKVTSQGVRYLTALGLLQPVAITPKGITLFNREAVELLRDQRRAQRRRTRRSHRTEAVNS